VKITDNVLLAVIHAIKFTISEREKDLARARIEDLYDHGRLQGSVDGLDEALSIIDRVLIGDEPDPDM